MTKNVDTPILDAARFRSDHWFESTLCFNPYFPRMEAFDWGDELARLIAATHASVEDPGTADRHTG